ncbi:kinetochore protein Spc25-like [Lineus longissimus]|uniref:kinetochore protein Spc25-like n=1 Tax=Lineus longissimus TaxID=88925 RepID=UPI002B4E4045
MAGSGEVMRRELQVELAEIKENLAQCRNNIVTQWEAKLLAYKEIKRRNEAELQLRKDEMSALDKDKVEGGYAIDDLRGSIVSIKLETDGLLLEKERLGEKVKVLQLEVETSKIALEEKEKSDEQKIVAIQKTMEWCREKMGILFIKIPGPVYKLQVIITNIDQKDPTTPFVFNMAVINRIYEVSDCEPKVDDLSNLVHKLNQTNNIRSFFILMRKRFKEMCTRTRK